MSRFERLTRLLERFEGEGGSGCAMAVSRNGQRIYEHYVGYADREEDKPIAPDTIYRLFSMSKMVTCVAALTLYEDGRYQMTDPLYEYLPEYRHSMVYRRAPSGGMYTSPAASPILIRDLFSMTSGLTYNGDDCPTAQRIAKLMEGINDKSGPTLREFAKSLAEVPLAFDPGTHWRYGVSHDLLGAFIEVVSGKTLGEYFRQAIFEPLGMKDTSFRLEAGKADRLCACYELGPDGKYAKTNRFDDWFSPDSNYESGGGGLLSTLSDYSRFLEMLACGGEYKGERVLSPNAVRLMGTNHLGPQQLKDYNWSHLAGYGYGLGVRVMIDPAAGGCTSSVGEFGWSGLLGTWAMVDPALGLSAVYMQQMMPSFEPSRHPRLRSALYGSL